MSPYRSQGSDPGIWPTCAFQMCAELRRNPGRIGLVVDDPLGKLMGAFADVLDVSVSRADACLLTPYAAGDPGQVITRLVTLGNLITDLDVLFWKPWLSLDPLGIIRQVSRRRPGILFSWPGTVHDGHASYSAPGRRDFFEAPITDALVLRPRVATFPDEPPYQIERIA